MALPGAAASLSPWSDLERARCWRWAPSSDVASSAAIRSLATPSAVSVISYGPAVRSIEQQTRAAERREARSWRKPPYQPPPPGSAAELASVLDWLRQPRVQLGSDSYLDVDPLDAEGPPSGYWPPFLPDSLKTK